MVLLPIASGLARGSKSANKLNHCDMSFDLLFEDEVLVGDFTEFSVVSNDDEVFDVAKVEDVDDSSWISDKRSEKFVESSDFLFCNKSISFWTVEGLAGLGIGKSLNKSWGPGKKSIWNKGIFKRKIHF